MTDISEPSGDVTLDRWQKIKLLALDVDGVLTDGTVYMGPDGLELKKFSVLDGLGLGCVREAGIILAVVSGRMSVATTARTKELKFKHIIQGRKDKAEALKELVSDLNLGQEEVCYMGDDIIDIPAIQYAGIGVSAANGLAMVKDAADFVTEREGGQGAVREVCDRILESRNETVLSMSKLL